MLSVWPFLCNVVLYSTSDSVCYMYYILFLVVIAAFTTLVWFIPAAFFYLYLLQCFCDYFKVTSAKAKIAISFSVAMTTY